MDTSDNPHRVLADASTYVFSMWQYKHDGSDRGPAAFAGPGGREPSTRGQPPRVQKVGTDRRASRRDGANGSHTTGFYSTCLRQPRSGSAVGQDTATPCVDARGAAHFLPEPGLGGSAAAAKRHC